MGLITDINGGRIDIMRQGYQITGICLETNLRVNKRQATIQVPKTISEIVGRALDRAHRKDGGRKLHDESNKIIIPVNSNQLYDAQILDEQSNKVRHILRKKFGLIPYNGKYQFFIRLTLISRNGSEQHHSTMLSYVSTRADEAILVHQYLHSKLVKFDRLNRVDTLNIADNAIPLLELIETIEPN